MVCTANHCPHCEIWTYGASPAPRLERLLDNACWLFWTSAATTWRSLIVLVMVVWFEPIRLARSLATPERLPTTSSSNVFFDANVEDSVCRLSTSVPRSPL